MGGSGKVEKKVLERNMKKETKDNKSKVKRKSKKKAQNQTDIVTETTVGIDSMVSKNLKQPKHEKNEEILASNEEILKEKIDQVSKVEDESSQAMSENILSM